MTPRDQIAILRCLQQRAELFEDIARLEAELHALLGDAARALAPCPPVELPSRLKSKRSVHAVPDRKPPRRKKLQTAVPDAPPLQEPFDRRDGKTPRTIVWTYQGETGQSLQIDPDLILALLRLPKDVLGIHVE